MVLCKTEEDAQQTRKDLRVWLDKCGLKLSDSKTRIVHLDEGFDFLGFNVRRYADVTEDSKKKRFSPGHKLLIKPSKEAVKRFKSKVKETFMMYKGASPAVLIDRMNVLTTGWGNYYRSVVSKKTFVKLDYHIFHRQVRWTKFRHKSKGWKWIRKHYFGKFAPNRKDVWVFGDRETGKYVRRLSWLKIERHVKVKGASSPDDPGLRDYWRQRQGRLLNFTGWYKTLAHRQNYTCPVCGSSLANDEETHLHHLITDRNDPQRSKKEYQQLVHYFCHQQLHGAKGVVVKDNLSR